MAHKLGMDLNGGVKDLKLGKTFNKGFKDEAYHTIRYDFKPASVDSQKVGSLDVADKEVTLTVPLMGGGGVSQEAVFKGNKTPSSKDCLLIFDHITGEIVLERISEHIRVKKTRTEGTNRRPLQKSLGPDLRQTKPSASQNYNSSCSAGVKLPLQQSPLSKSPNCKSSASLRMQATSVNAGSMPLLNFEDEQKNDSIMSDSSSDSDSNSGSSSSSCSGSDSDTEQQLDKAANPQPHSTNGHGPKSDILKSRHKSPSSVLSDLELSEED